MLSQIDSFLSWLDGFIWGVPMWVLVMFTGLLYTFRLRFLSVKKLPLALKYLFRNEDNAEGEISSFGAICTTLAGNLGTGNIVGVATALVAGGPGALFWIWIVAFFGMATKYGEGLLAVKYRTVHKEGHTLGGPFYYIERGMGENWKPLAKAFAFFGALATAGGIGTATQINGISDAVKNLVDPNREYNVMIGSLEVSWVSVVLSIVISVVVAIILMGGLKRIAHVAEIIVPVMGIIYMVYCLLILIFNASHIPTAFYNVFVGAFNPRAVTGGAIGSFIITLRSGIARGVFSSETCLGSAPIAAAAAKTNEPARQGLVTMNSNFIDTLVICTCTGIAIVMTDSWNVGLNGVSVTTRAFEVGIPFLPHGFADTVMMLCLVFFAFTTMVGWEYYGEKCWEYLFNGSQKACTAYRWLYVAVIFIGGYLSVDTIWTISDILCGLMAFPNIIALVALLKKVLTETDKYFGTELAGPAAVTAGAAAEQAAEKGEE